MNGGRNQARSPDVFGDLWAIHWLVLATLVVALIVGALGYYGFQEHFRQLGESRSVLTLVYLSLQLFILESGGVEGHVPWELNLARFLAPLMSAATAAALLLVVLQQVESLRIRFMSDHAIVCGLGEKGSLLVRSLRERDRGVVAIERDASNDSIQAARLNGARVVVGDARSVDILRQAGAQRAAHLFAVCGDDGANAEIATAARSLATSRSRGALNCSAHIVDPHLCMLLRREELAGPEMPEFRLDFFNVFDSGAQALLRGFPPFTKPPQPSDQRPHIVVVGLGHLGEAIVVQIARTWVDLGAPDAERLRITMIDESAESKAESLALRHPDLALACDLIPRQMRPGSPEFEREDYLGAAEPGSRIRIVYVCLESDTQALSAALTLQQRLGPSTVPVVLAMARSGGLAGLLGRAVGRADTLAGLENLHTFALLDRTLTTDLLLGGTYEVLARAMHEEYLRQQAAEGQTPETNQAMAAWDELAESLKESNRAQAAHIGVKLRAARCALVPLKDDNAAAFEFPPAETELLAEMEHDRWVKERRRDGWTYAQGAKDIARKTSPHMVPWDELGDDVKEWDRTFVRGLPKFLAKAGFQIVRVESQ